MKTPIRFLAALGCALLGHVGGSARPDPVPDTIPLAPPPKVAPAQPFGECGGWVKSMTKDSLTILSPGYWEEMIPIDAQGRSQPERATKTWVPPPPPRQLFVRRPLATGLLGDREPDAYRLEDVKVGDYVRIRSTFVNGENVCGMITISRRPGGRVPPSPNHAIDPDSKIPPHHVLANVLADRDERGIPIPAQYRRWVEPTPDNDLPPLPPRIPPATP